MDIVLGEIIIAIVLKPAVRFEGVDSICYCVRRELVCRNFAFRLHILILLLKLLAGRAWFSLEFWVEECCAVALTVSVHQTNFASLLCQGGRKLDCSRQIRRCHPHRTSHSHYRTPALRSLQRKACKALLEDCAAFSHVIPKLQRVWSSPCTTIV